MCLSNKKFHATLGTTALVFYESLKSTVWVQAHDLSFPILSYPIPSYPTLSYPILSDPILSYPILPYPILILLNLKFLKKIYLDMSQLFGCNLCREDDPDRTSR